MPNVIKCFRAVNYEGTQAKIDGFQNTSINASSFTISGGTINTSSGEVSDVAGNNLGIMDDDEYYNIDEKDGWHVTSISTNEQSGSVSEFIEKEGKYFNKINGSTTTSSNLDTSEFSVQGIGFPLINPADTQTESQVTVQATDADGENL